MKVIIQNTAHNSIDSIFDYLSNYSIKNAIETIEGIYDRIYSLENSPYIGIYVPEIYDKHFRELIYKKNKKSVYRIVYYISESNGIIHIISIINCKQNFIKFLKLHNYFKNYYIL